jgi:hypothetical protein
MIKKLFKVIISWWLALKWWWTGGVLSAQLSDHGSPQRTEAEEAVDRIVRETRVAPDCVAATVLRGGATIIITHDNGKEAFIGRSYDHAANKVIEWLLEREGRFAKFQGVSRISLQGQQTMRVRARRRHRKR